MSTYAIYYVWAGILIDEFDALHAPFVDEVLENFDGIQINNVTFVGIGMHGKTIGIGVVVHELNWETEIGPANLYNPETAQNALLILNLVNQTLQERGIEISARLYQHIDLGG